MKKIALLSDTHGWLDQKMIDFLKSADEIWHAGDIGTLEVLDNLKNLRPIKAVYGNIDDQKIRMDCPKDLIFEVEQVKVFITHIGGYPNNYAPGIKKILQLEKPKLFISGHSHILKVIYDKQYEVLHLNPGAAGLQGFQKLRTMLRFKIEGDQIKELEIWEHKR